MATPQQQNYQPPQCEDYHSDDSSEDHVLQESFRRSPSAAGQANVAAKRSHPSDLSTSGKSPAHEKVPVNIDLQSDSGYSSHTAATMSSADSAPSANASHSPPIPPASVAAPSMPPPSPATTAMRRRPTNAGDDRRTASQNSPRKPLQRTGSVSSRRKERRSTVTEECTVPDCECGHSRTTAAPSSSRTRRTTDSSPLDSGLDISYPPFDGTPSSPAYTRQRVPYQQGLAMVQPAQTRRRSSSTTRRPMSYHGEPGQGYWVPGMPAPYQPPTPQEIGPPLAMNNRYSMHPQQMPSYPVGPPTPGGYYSNGQVSQFDMRPSMVSRGSSSNYVTRSYGPTVVTQERNQYSARYPSQPQSARQERFPQFEDESSDSEDIYSSEEEEEERSSRNARALVARPKVSKDMTQRRPSLRHANTTSVVTRRMSQSQAPLERPSRERRQSRERGPRSSRATTAVPSRNPSVTRPALIQHPKAQSYETTRNAQVVVENPRSRRRQSYQGYDSKVYDSKVYDSKVYDKVYANEAYDKEYILEQKRRNRASRSFRDDRDDRDDHQDRHAREQEAVPLANSRRRQTDVDSRMRDESIIESNKRTQMDAEAYQQRVRGSYDPFTEQVHKAAKSASRIPSGGRSENGSSRSKGSDRASRVSQSNRTTVTSGGANGEIRLRVDPSAPLTLSFNGDMEGRTLQINPAEDGMADIVIGNSRGNENQYRSERGSVMGGAMGGARKAIMANQARREAEELSVKSSRSAQSRRDRERDGERRTLRRRRDIEYH